MSELERIKVDVYNLRVGMFVAALDRPWSQTSFPLQGFAIRSARELSALKSVCQYVYIDASKSKFESEEARLFIISKTERETSAKDRVQRSSKPLQINHQFYEAKNVFPTKEQYKETSQILENVSNSLQDVYENLRSGSRIDEQQLDTAAEMLTSAIINAPTTAYWAALLQEHDDVIYNHGLRSATWALLCGRHIGVDDLQLKRMAQGILLKDVYRLTTKKTGQERVDPVLISTSLLRESGAHPKVVAVVKYHREKFNGSGRPFGLVGEKIPFLARIASIATAYDLTLHPINPKSKARSPSQAAKILYEQKGKAFQEELVVEFIEAIGLYPLGTSVELSTGETGVVVKNYPERRLKPELLVVKDADGNQVDQRETIDLGEANGVSIKRDLVNEGGKTYNELIQIFENSVLELAANDSRSGRGLIKRLFGG